LSDGLRTDKLPQRVALFGMPALSPGYLQLLQQLSGWMDIHLFLLNPCQAHWADIVDPAEKQSRELSAREPALYLEVGNPLLASLGRQGRDAFAMLLEHDPGSHELFEEAQDDCLLHLLQGDILQLLDASAGPPREIDDADQSIRIHSCHSPMRELEVLRDQLLDLFERLPDLQPEDVLVLTPDMTGYAPYIETLFGEIPGIPFIPFSIADPQGGAGSALIEGYLKLLELPSGRYDANTLLGLLQIPALQRRFGLNDGDLPMLLRWVEESAIRWGQDADTRRQLGLPATEQNSWQSGLDRLLLGYALPGDGEHLFHGKLPIDAVEGSDAAVLGALGAFAQAVFSLQGLLAGRHQLQAWSERLLRVIELFFEADDQEDSQLQQLRNAIRCLVDQAGLAGFDEPLPLDPLRAHLARQLESLDSGGRFLAGGVNFSTLTPLRSLPFEVVCLIGMSDGQFPRDHRAPGFDLMAHDYRFGDRSHRADDRYLFLETLISARRCLYISYIGQDIRENTSLPPSVLVSELLEYLDQGFRFKNGQRIGERLLLRHPLQGFNPGYFKTGGPLFSYSPDLASAARAALRPPRPVRPLLSEMLPEPEPHWRHVELEQLVGFFANPTRYLLRQRLGILLQEGEGLLETRDPFELDYFQYNRITRRLVQGELSGKPFSELLELERAAGLLPHGTAGERIMRQMQVPARQFARQLQTESLQAGSEVLEVDVESGGLRLSGRIVGVGERGIAGYCVEKIPVSQLLGLWVRHLALNTLTVAGVTLETRWLDQDGMIRFPPLEDAESRLGELLQVYWQGLRLPLPLFPKSALVYMRERQRGKDRLSALAKAELKWRGGYQGFGECLDLYYRLAFPDADQLGDDFCALSERVFGPMLQAMQGD
jgi:exodeoxyribonuclease V gamma subunit